MSRNPSLRHEIYFCFHSYPLAKNDEISRQLGKNKRGWASPHCKQEAQSWKQSLSKCSWILYILLLKLWNCQESLELIFFFPFSKTKQHRLLCSMFWRQGKFAESGKWGPSYKQLTEKDKILMCKRILLEQLLFLDVNNLSILLIEHSYTVSIAMFLQPVQELPFIFTLTSPPNTTWKDLPVSFCLCPVVTPVLEKVSWTNQKFVNPTSWKLLPWVIHVKLVLLVKAFKKTIQLWPDERSPHIIWGLILVS